MEKQVTNKVKGLIKDEVCMGTYGLVELEVRELEQIKDDLLEALIRISEAKDVILFEEFAKQIAINAINKATTQHGN